MTDNEKRAHDLAILYMQLEIKHERINLDAFDDFTSFVNEYKHCHDEIISEFERI